MSTGRPTSRISRFYQLDPAARRAVLRDQHGLSEEDFASLTEGPVDVADKMIENCIGVLPMPIGLGLNLQVNGRDYTIPMAVEEPSVIAAVSHSALVVRRSGGFVASADAPRMIAQIQLLGIPEPVDAIAAVQRDSATLLEQANIRFPAMARRGGGASEIRCRYFSDGHPMLVVHLIVDCVDAMGANAVNTMAEHLSPALERLTGGRANLRILSNLADQRLARASCSIDVTALETSQFFGPEVADRITDAYRFAAIDPYRAATHNKGVMNGIDAVAIATGNDWRGVEAGAHAFAARDGHYTSLTRWWHAAGRLHGEIELPLAVGTVGGSTAALPAVRTLRKILAVDSARELAAVMAAVGLAQNLGAVRALTTDGIQRGHIALHARTVALAAGAVGNEIELVAGQMVERGEVGSRAAKRLLSVDPLDRA